MSSAPATHRSVEQTTRATSFSFRSERTCWHVHGSFNTNHRFEFQKSLQQFIRTHNETVSVVMMHPQSRSFVRWSQSLRRSPQLTPALTPSDERSEEHTSELQSHSDLVCRLLLEKKKTKKKTRE